jgi:hypothetical protein
MHDGVALVALARQRRIVARRPARAPAGFDGDKPRGAGGFALRRAEQVPKTIEHKKSPPKRALLIGGVNSRSFGYIISVVFGLIVNDVRRNPDLVRNFIKRKRRHFAPLT